jgi:hypothetical protein
MAAPLSLTDAELRRRQRVRNLVLLIVLLAVAGLFYAISIVKFRLS